MKTLAAVAGAGAITPVGLRAMDTAFSHRAAAAAMREAPLVDAAGEPVTMAFLPTLDPLLTGAARAYALGTRALAEVLESLGPRAGALRVRLAVCLDEHLAQRPPEGDAPAERLAAELATFCRKRLPQLTVTVSTRGPAGPGYLLPEIVEELAVGTLDAVLLGGIHTDYDPSRIAALDAAGRLFRPPDNLEAVLPGEAAAFVALVHPEVARRSRWRAHAAIHGITTGYERARPDNDESAFQAAGLTAALRMLLSPLAEEQARVGWVLTDLGFETFRHFEFQAAATRTQRFFCEPQQVESPAQRMGNLGAAAMPLHLVLAAEAFRRGYAPHRWAVSIAGSDGGERAAMLVAGLR